MKHTTISINRLIPVLGIALLGGGLLGAAIHSKLEEETQSGEAQYSALGRLHLDAGLCSVLRSMHEGDVNAAAQRLDLLLCDDLLALNSEFSSIEGADRAYIKGTFARFSLVRPKRAALLVATGQEPTRDQMEAERMLTRAAGGITPASKGVAVLP